MKEYTENTVHFYSILYLLLCTYQVPLDKIVSCHNKDNDLLNKIATFKSDKSIVVDELILESTYLNEKDEEISETSRQIVVIIIIIILFDFIYFYYYILKSNIFLSVVV